MTSKKTFNLADLIKALPKGEPAPETLEKVRQGLELYLKRYRPLSERCPDRESQRD